jgi:hypothetical protein
VEGPILNSSHRGFVTIATGKEHYYKIAYNLLCSYRLNAGRYPFAIICDRENKYTAAFDKVVHISDPSHSYMDKLRLHDCLPYDETIFIDADCLVYGDIDRWWELFDKAGDCSVFGCAYDDLSTERGWFRTEGMGKYRDSIRFVPSFSGGVYYLRNTETCRRVFDVAKEAAANYGDYPFAIFRDPADEPVIALGMAVAGCRPVECGDVGLYTYKRFTRAEITAPKAEWYYKEQWTPIILVHWGNFGTMKAFYLTEASAARRKLKGKPEKGLAWTILYRWKILYCLLHICDLATMVKRLNRRIRKKLKHIRG